MPNLLEVFGESPKEKGGFQKTLFYFLKEIPIYPFDVESTVTPVYEEKSFWIFKWRKRTGYKIIKKGMSIPMFKSLIKQIDEHYKKEEEAYQKAKRK